MWQQVWISDITTKLPHSDEPPRWWVVLEWLKVMALVAAVLGGLVAVVVYPSDPIAGAIKVAGFGMAAYLGGTFLAPDVIRASFASFRASSSKESNQVFTEALRVDRSSAIWLPRRIQGIVMIGWAVTVLALGTRILVRIR